MEGRLFELIRDYQEHRTASAGAKILEFRENALREFARVRPELYPEYFVDETRIHRAIAEARLSGEIINAEPAREDWLVLRWDRDHPS